MFPFKVIIDVLKLNDMSSQYDTQRIFLNLRCLENQLLLYDSSRRTFILSLFLLLSILTITRIVFLHY